LPPGDIFSRLTEEERQQHQDLEDRVERLLDSAIAAIRDALGDDFAPLEKCHAHLLRRSGTDTVARRHSRNGSGRPSGGAESKGQADAAFGAMISRH
jgi:hypothetical protein